MNGEVLAGVYRAVVDDIRTRHNMSCEPWLNVSHGDFCESHYPNIAAEMAATMYFKSTVARHAMISPNVLMAVIEDNESLSCAELLGLCRLFECRFSYLGDSKLHIIDPATNDGKKKLYKLMTLANLADGLDHYLTHQKRKAERICQDLTNGSIITAADYRWAKWIFADTIRRSYLTATPIRCTRFKEDCPA